jgi:hypothetical protein
MSESTQRRHPEHDWRNTYLFDPATRPPRRNRGPSQPHRTVQFR